MFASAEMLGHTSRKEDLLQMNSRTQTQNAIAMDTLIAKNKSAIVKYVMKQHRKNDLDTNFQVETDTDGFTKSGSINTQGIHFKQIMNKLGVDEYVNIKINPILPVRLCFWNSHTIIKILNKHQPNRFVVSLGFNPTSCQCSQFITLEPHAVVYDTETKSYHDFTIDFGGETEKIFIPIWTDMENKISIDALSTWGFNHRWYVNKMGEHQCRNHTRSGKYRPNSRQSVRQRVNRAYLWRVKCFRPIPDVHSPIDEFDKKDWDCLSWIVKCNFINVNNL